MLEKRNDCNTEAVDEATDSLYLDDVVKVATVKMANKYKEYDGHFTDGAM